MLSDREIREILGRVPETAAQPESESAAPRKNPWPMVLGVLAVLGLALWGAGIAVILHFEKSAPHQPVAGTGETVRFNDPFSVVYLTARQHALVDGALIILPLVTILIVVAAIMTFGRTSAAEEG
jgi:hypothetical protein